MKQTKLSRGALIALAFLIVGQVVSISALVIVVAENWK